MANQRRIYGFGTQNLFSKAMEALAKETLEHPTTLRDNGRVIAGVDRVHGNQAARLW
jgi:hypothetical protein